MFVPWLWCSDGYWLNPVISSSSDKQISTMNSNIQYTASSQFVNVEPQNKTVECKETPAHRLVTKVWYQATNHKIRLPMTRMSKFLNLLLYLAVVSRCCRDSSLWRNPGGVKLLNLSEYTTPSPIFSQHESYNKATSSQRRLDEQDQIYEERCLT